MLQSQAPKPGAVNSGSTRGQPGVNLVSTWGRPGVNLHHPTSPPSSFTNRQTHSKQGLATPPVTSPLAAPPLVTSPLAAPQLVTSPLVTSPWAAPPVTSPPNAPPLVTSPLASPPSVTPRYTGTIRPNSQGKSGGAASWDAPCLEAGGQGGGGGGESHVQEGGAGK